LRRGEECRRLEHRAARMLQLLADAEGAIVPQDKIIGEVWNGRSLSDNSISVVVSQLRRLLDDDARRPLLIETVPKRGYRLVGLRSEASAAPKQRSAFARVLVPVAMALTLILGASAWLRSEPTVVKPSLTVTDVVNATGNGGHAPLARATSELIVDQLERRGFELRRGTQGSDLVVSSKLVMWDGAPYLGMTATDRRAVVRWSAMIRGDGGRIPAGVSAELDRFEAKIAEPEAAARLAPAQTDR
jgi:DNA-binding winged helix-turn-helix (wHTH) protein